MGGTLKDTELDASEKLVPIGNNGWCPYERVPHGNGFVNPVAAKWAADPRQGCLFGCMHEWQVGTVGVGPSGGSEIIIVRTDDPRASLYGPPALRRA